MQSQGQDIFRMKGVLSIEDEDRRYIFHGVHMMFDGKFERPWGATPRNNSLVFIGRKLDRQEIEAGFESCIAASARKMSATLNEGASSRARYVHRRSGVVAGWRLHCCCGW